MDEPELTADEFDAAFAAGTVEEVAPGARPELRRIGDGPIGIPFGSLPAAGAAVTEVRYVDGSSAFEMPTRLPISA